MARAFWRRPTGGTAEDKTSGEGFVRRWILGTPSQLASGAALLALVAVFIVAIRPDAGTAVVIISLACVCGSWLLLMGGFTVEHARLWASSDGFEFPGDDELQFADFIYLAVQASTGYSSGDVRTMNRQARHLVTAHALTAFVLRQ